jgi:hypothetical protein
MIGWWNHLSLTDLSRLPGRLFHGLREMPPDYSSSGCRERPVRPAPDVGEGGFAWASNLNLLGLQKSSIGSLRPGRVLPHVFVFAAEGPVVREMLQALVLFWQAVSSAREMDQLIFPDFSRRTRFRWLYYTCSHCLVMTFFGTDVILANNSTLTLSPFPNDESISFKRARSR